MGRLRRPRWLVTIAAGACLIQFAMLEVSAAPASAASSWPGTQFCNSFSQSQPLTGPGYDGVQPCGGSYGGAVGYKGVTFDSGGWQCVELAARWFYAYTGQIPPAVLYGKNVAAQYHSPSYPMYPVYPPSGGTATYDLTIRPGDIISMWGPATSDSAGHVAVVTAISVTLTNGANGTGSIKVMEENGSSSGVATINVSGGQMSYGTPGSKFYYNEFQWLELAPGPSGGTAVPGVPSWPRISTAVGTNKDGRLEVFHVGQNGQLYHAWQTSANSTAFSSWQSLGGSWPRQDSIAVTSNSDGRLEVFLVGYNGALYHAWQTSPGGTWSSWQSLGGSWSSTDSIAVAQNANGVLEAFLVGYNSVLYHAWQTSAGSSTWSSWHSLGGTWSLRDAIAVAQNSDGRLEVFLVAQNGQLDHAWQTSPEGSWSSWAGLGGNWPTQDSIGLAVNQDGRLEAFMIGNDGHIYNAWQEWPGGSWSAPSWQLLGGNWPSSDSVSVATNPSDGQMEVVLIGYSGHLYTAEQMGAGGSWTTWSSLGGTLPSLDGIAEAANADGRLQTFLTGYNSQLYTTWQTQPDAAWSSWKSLGGSFP